jgi:hypothetical protein
LAALEALHGDILGDILRRIDCKVKQFFEQVMQMDSFTLRLEAMPDKDVLTLENVSYCYPSQPLCAVLNDLSLSISLELRPIR